MRYEDMHYCCQQELDEYRAKTIQPVLDMLKHAASCMPDISYDKTSADLLQQAIKLLEQEP